MPLQNTCTAFKELEVKDSRNLQCWWEFPICCRHVSHASGRCCDSTRAYGQQRV